MSLSKQILIALVAGVAVGLFFGDKVGFLEIGGRAFVQALQVTVLPYVAGSLIAGFGSMRREDAQAHGQPRGPAARPALGALAGPRVPAAARPARRQGGRLLLLRGARARARDRLARPLHPGEPLPLPREQRGPGGGRLRRARRRRPHGPAPQAGAPRAPARLQRGHGTRGESARPAHPVRHLRDRRPHRRHHAARRVRAAAGLRAHLRRLRLPADLLAAPGAGGRADAGRPPADDRDSRRTRS